MCLKLQFPDIAEIALPCAARCRRRLRKINPSLHMSIASVRPFRLLYRWCKESCVFGRAAIDVRPREWRPRELRRLAARWMLVAFALLQIRSTCQHETLQNQFNFAHVNCFPMATYQRVTLQHQFNLAFRIVFLLFDAFSSCHLQHLFV